ncbi:MAG: hypoxanthine phosphoribosyltransferase [Saprospiraceae bacterium]|nr:hypoxanthine phosphoribosyltransferase [Bacteroidia bacterium]NNF22236.1 hypoxanthine phosphoribosyltransferase [Saprospiraceae bacterium]
MKEVSFFDKTFELYIPSWEISNVVYRMAKEINEYYNARDEEVVLISILDGAFIFMADLVRQLEFEHEINFVKLKSYKDMESTGAVETLLDVGVDLKGKHVLIVEDIVDTGLTMEKFMDHLRSKEPVSVRICTFLSKPEVHNDIFPIDFVGLEIPPLFVLGYGLDLNRRGRHLPSIYKLKV